MGDKVNLQKTVADQDSAEVPNPETLELLQPVEADLTGFSLEAVDGLTGKSPRDAFVGRYEVVRRLGQGGFGVVLLARDSELGRLVAIKLPHVHRMQNESFRQMYLVEARTLASLDHPSIVPIYDCGVIADGRCFVVSKYIEGRDLARVVADGPLNAVDIARMLADVAEALHHVHQMRIVHRDIKPANLLLGDDGRIYVADFGLALQDSPLQSSEPNAGTPNYMSPEQIRGEGHRVDGRSDQFSLGVVMFELLTGERPFAGGSLQDILHRVQTLDPLPPRQWNPSVPQELDRICQKLLSKLATQRYATTIELAQDLRDWLRTVDESETDGSGLPAALPLTLTHEIIAARKRQDGQVTVIPRGLRAFTRADAYFFQDLLPGTRDRDGLPVSISHWRRWVMSREESPELQRVGVISGPTGCGKSSLVRAGLLPVLSSSVASVIVEATADMTESQLLAAIQRQCGESAGDSLTEALARIRRGHGLRDGQTLLLVIDQFEQWLHAHPDPLDTELVHAIRQCDGIGVQCLLLIRDDFWLALSRFMEAVEAPVQLGRNAMMVDLFDLRHARCVLIEFGRGYDRLPETGQTLSRDQDRFIDGAISLLAEDGKMIPVHLALFAELVKSRDWLPATLRQLGGAVGIGAQFLFDAFSAGYAPANQRAHEDAARRILHALLPELGTEIKAGRRTRCELRSESGYADDSHRFDLLMTILESDLKLISASDTLDRTRSETLPVSTENTTYQLSHDFLVPSIREWLTARQRESFRGRLHQRLSEQARLWSRHHDARFLPNMGEWLVMRALLSSAKLSQTERQMLANRDRRSLASFSLSLLLLALVTIGVVHFRSQTRVAALIDQLSTADSLQTTGIIENLSKFGASAEHALTSATMLAADDPRKRFVLQLARLKWKPDPVPDVFEYVLSSASADDIAVARQALQPWSHELVDRCWELLEDPSGSPELTGLSPSLSTTSPNSTAFRAGQLLALFDPPDDAASRQRWSQSATRLSDLLVQACIRHPDQYQTLAESLLPCRSVLIEPLSKYLGTEADDSAARFAIALLQGYTRTDHRLRTQLCLDASSWQQESMLPSQQELVVDVLWEAVREPLNQTEPEDVQNRMARRHAVAAALLLAKPSVSGLEQIWPVLKHSPFPTARSHLIQQMARLNVPISRLAARLEFESDPGICAGILMGLGNYSQNSPPIDSPLMARVVQLYGTHPDAGVHSAAEWLLKKWQQDTVVENLPSTVPDPETLRSLPGNGWVRMPDLAEDVAGHTLVRVNATDADKVGLDFLIASHEVTIRQFHVCDPTQYVAPNFHTSVDCPAHVITWPKAVAYCNWLSQREGITPFYPTDPDELDHWVSSAEHLQRDGYRLPTTAEWEMACSGPTDGIRYFGTDIRLLKHYAWYEGNNDEFLNRIGWPSRDPEIGVRNKVCKPVGMLLPNDLGLFDMLGNLDEWCDDPGVSGPKERMIRGANIGSDAYAVSLERRGSHPVLIEYNSIGFRIARTVPPR